MRDFLRRFRDSAGHYRSIRALTVTSMFIALNIVLDLFTIPITPTLRFSLGFLPMAMIGMLYGPCIAMGAGMVGDILSYVLVNYRFGEFFPGYTISAIVGGLIYGLVLYRRPVKLYRAFLAKGLVNILVNILLNPLWMWMTRGKAYLYYMGEHALKNALLLPAEGILLFLVAVLVIKAAGRAGILPSDK